MVKKIYILTWLSLVLLLTGCTQKTHTQVVKFEDKSYQKNWALHDLNPNLPSDWSSYNYLTFELNAASPQRFYLNLFDASGERKVRLLPFQNTWVRASIPLIHFQQRNLIGHDMAAISKTALPGLCINFTGAVGPITQIDSVGVEMNDPINSPTLEIRNVRLTQEPLDSVLQPLPVVDQYGQWIPDEWPDKAHSLADLQSFWKEEEEALQLSEFKLSEYGGYLDTKARASGFFRVEKIDGKWWFIDPGGHYFFSLGSTGIGPGPSFSRVEGREYIYHSFPPDELTGKDARIQKAGFYNWNLYRRFGSDWYNKWAEMTFRRMDSWGLNTIANWSDENLGQRQKKAYVYTLRGWGFNPKTMGMPDVYRPDYAASVDDVAKKQCLPLKNDPFLLGYFVGNEPPWPGREMDLTNAILEGDDSPMKAALQAFLSDGDTPEKRKTFVYDTYNKFITLVNAAIKKYDPNHLNLGLRFGGNPPDDIIKASALVGFDVFSLNIYGYSASPERLNKIDRLTGLPIIIGEFHFGVPGRGLAPGLAQTSNQYERGAAYQYYVENAAAHPSLIGTHWFQWWDQPSTGRFDGENYNIGFVNVTDKPYKELVDAARETHHRIKDIHGGKTAPTSRQAKRQ